MAKVEKKRADKAAAAVRDGAAKLGDMPSPILIIIFWPWSQCVPSEQRK